MAEAVAFFESHPEPFEAPQQVEAEQDPDASEESQDEQPCNAEEDLRLCGEKISALLKEGQEIPDELYVALFVAKLRTTYPHQSKAQ